MTILPPFLIDLYRTGECGRQRELLDWSGNGGAVHCQGRRCFVAIPLNQTLAGRDTHFIVSGFVFAAFCQIFRLPHSSSVGFMMLDNPYKAPKVTEDRNSKTSVLLVKNATYLLVPSMLFVIPVFTKFIPLWQAPLWVGSGFLMCWGAESFGSWLFSSGLTFRKRLFRRTMYCLPMLIWAMLSIYKAYGIVASVLVAFAVIPGFTGLLLWDRASGNKDS